MEFKNIDLFVKHKDKSKKIEESKEKSIIKSTIREGINWLELDEIKKTEEDLKLIKEVVEMVNGYKKEIGLADDFKLLDINQIHFIDDPEMPEVDWGYFREDNFNVYINANSKKANLERTLIHEMLHLNSKIKVVFDNLDYYLYKTSEENSVVSKFIFNEPEVLNSRVGYDLGEKLMAFNEAITEKLTDEIWKKQGKDGVYEENETYTFWKDSLEIILNRFQNEERKKIWEDIQRGYFTGEMMHLRKLEKEYGKGFLKFLANFNDIFDELNYSYEEAKEFFRTAKEKDIEKILEDYDKKIKK